MIHDQMGRNIPFSDYLARLLNRQPSLSSSRSREPFEDPVLVRVAAQRTEVGDCCGTADSGWRRQRIPGRSGHQRMGRHQHRGGHQRGSGHQRKDWRGQRIPAWGAAHPRPSGGISRPSGHRHRDRQGQRIPAGEHTHTRTHPGLLAEALRRLGSPVSRRKASAEGQRDSEMDSTVDVEGVVKEEPEEWQPRIARDVVLRECGAVPNGPRGRDRLGTHRTSRRCQGGAMRLVLPH